MANNKPSLIPNSLRNASVEFPYVAESVDIYDKNSDKNQEQINAEIDNTLDLHQSEINALDSQNYETYTADDQTSSVTDVLPATGEKDTIYRVGNWDGEQYDPTVYSEYAWDANNNEYKLLDVKQYTLATAEDFIEPDAEKRAKIPTVGAVADVYGAYEENPELVEAKTDSEGKVLEGTRKDGTKVLCAGLEVNGDTKISGDVEFNKASIKVIENPEFVKVELDMDRRILEGTRKDGTKTFYSPVNLQGTKHSVINNPEWISAILDRNGKVLEGISSAGKRIGNIDVQFGRVEVNELNLTEHGMEKLQDDLEAAGFNPIDESQLLKSISINGTPLPKNENNINLPIASVSDYGLMSPQDKMALGSLQPSINISGSGITKNAAAFGFLPTATAADNNNALANALNGGGTILVDMPGIYDISEPIIIHSNTTLIFGSNTYVRMNANKYAVVNSGAYTRTYNENIKLIGLNLIANGHIRPDYDITLTQEEQPGVIYGLMGYVNFFYVKNLYLCGYTLFDQEHDTYFANICTFENVVVERCMDSGMMDGLHFGRGKHLTVRDCVFSCYDDACTFNAVDFTRSQPEVGWIDGVVVENCYDLSNPNHVSTGYFSRFMGGAWKDWEENDEVMLGSIVIVERDGMKYMYRVAGGYSYGPDMRGWKFTTITKPSNTVVGTVEWLDEQTVTRTINGNTETTTMKIPWVLQQTQDVGYDGGCKNITLRNIHLRKQRTFTIQYYVDDLWFNAIVNNAIGKSVQENITFDGIYQEYETSDIKPGDIVPNSLVYITSLVQNIKILNSTIKNRNCVYEYKQSYQGLEYDTQVFLIENNIFCGDTWICPAVMNSGGNTPNRIRMSGNIKKDAEIPTVNYGGVYITNDIV